MEPNRAYIIRKNNGLTGRLVIMEFCDVSPVDVKVHNLSLSIKPEAINFQKIRRKPPVAEKQVLQNISLDVPAGSLMAILGESGSGKVNQIFWNAYCLDFIVEPDG